MSRTITLLTSSRFIVVSHAVPLERAGKLSHELSQRSVCQHGPGSRLEVPGSAIDRRHNNISYKSKNIGNHTKSAVFLLKSVLYILLQDIKLPKKTLDSCRQKSRPLESHIADPGSTIA